jgi:hypothetical protein
MRTNRIRPNCSYDRKSVFQLNPNGPELSFLDLETAYELCETIPNKGERNACYIAFGIDGDAMQKHYPFLSKMEYILYPIEEPFFQTVLKRLTQSNTTNDNSQK